MSSPISMKAPCTPRSHITYISEECRRNALKNRAENEWFSHVPHTDANNHPIKQIKNGDDRLKSLNGNIQKKMIKSEESTRNGTDLKRASKSAIKSNTSCDYADNIKEPMIDYPNNASHYSNVEINKQQKEDNNKNIKSSRYNNNNKRPKNSLSLALNKNLKNNNKDLTNIKKKSDKRTNNDDNFLNTSSDEHYTITGNTSTINSDRSLKNPLHNRKNAKSTNQTSSLRPLSLSLPLCFVFRQCSVNTRLPFRLFKLVKHLIIRTVKYSY